MVELNLTTAKKRPSAVARLSAEPLDDEARLRQLGYKQELTRELSLLKNFAVSFGLLSMLTGLGGFYTYGFTHGGPVSVIWGWPLAVTMTLTVALPMAEVCSALPTSGGVYFWAGTLGGRHGPLYSWITGWFNLLGQVGITAGVEYTVVMYLQQVISISEGRYYEFTRAQQYGLYCGFIILHGVANAISVKLLGWLSVVSVYWHVLGTLGVVIGLLVIAPVHQSADWVFGTFIPNPDTGVSNPFYLFLLGLLMSQWAMTGYDTSAHIAEETKNAAIAGPVGLIMAIVGSFICGWMFLLSLTFSIQDPANITNPDTISGGYATSQIFMDAFAARFNGNTKPALAFMLILFVASNWCGTFCITANSRMLYAFSRDDGIPGSRWWKRVNPTTGTPVNSIIAMGAAAILLGLSLLGSTVAFSAMSSIGVIGMYISYAIPQFLRLTVARKWFKKGPFHLGKFSLVIGWIGVFWCAFITVVFALPNQYPVNSQTLNYAPVAVGVTLIFSLGWWLLSARKWFKGPVRNVDVAVKTACLAEAYQRGELDDASEPFTKSSDDGELEEAPGPVTSV
ncbi:AOC1 [Auxenochlorella protothecoides x Auxenochlorella symbiontica]